MPAPTDVVSVHAVAVLRRLTGEGPVTPAEANNAVRQAVGDAIHGSFGQYPTASAARVSDNLQIDPIEEHEGAVRCSFRFDFPSDMFSAESGGLQHLIGILCGDTFRAPSGGVSWSSIKFTQVDLPQMFREQLWDSFGSYSHDLESTRTAFGLGSNRPLLAFSYKPRTGVDYAEFARTAMEVLDAGFNLVEPDTRRITWPSEFSQWASLGRRAATVKPGRTAFAPNLSLPADVVVSAVTAWRQSSPSGPFVIKVDGGLDGISAVQAIRREMRTERPIITCYPLLVGALSRLPPGFFALCLLLSGADIIYPGNRPDLSGGVRAIDADHEKSYHRSVVTYDRIAMEYKKMPTYAGGAHPADLHVVHAMLGPETGLFLGGAVALHSEGPKAGAELCVAIVEQAAKMASRRSLAEIRTSLVGRIETNYGGRAHAGYLPPEPFFSESDESQFPVRPYWDRER